MAGVKYQGYSEVCDSLFISPHRSFGNLEISGEAKCLSFPQQMVFRVPAVV